MVSDLHITFSIWDIFGGLLSSITFIILYFLMRFFVIPRLKDRKVIKPSQSDIWTWGITLGFVLVISLHLFVVFGNLGGLSAGWIALVIILGLGFIILPVLRSSLLGFIYSLRTRIDTGDVVQIGAVTGHVKEMGFTGVKLVDAEDNLHFLPNSEVVHHGIKKLAQSDMLEITLQIPLPKMNLEELHTRLLFAPYIAPGSNVEINRHGDQEIEIKFHLIHATFKEPVRRYLDQLVW
jgi:small-conductance mechanosensitive channel